MIDIASTFISLFPNAFSFVSNALVGRKKKKDIDAVFLDYKMKAYGVRSKVDLAKLLDNKALCDEFVAHCYLGDKTKEETAHIFVSSYGLSEPDNVATDFMCRLFDEIDSIIKRTKSGDAKALASGVNRANVYGSEILQAVNRIEQKCDAESDRSIELDYLASIVENLEAGGIGLQEAEEMASAKNGSLVSRYLFAYVGLCKECSVDLAFLQELNRDDRLLSSLACCALSASDFKSTALILSCSEEDTEALVKAVLNLSVGVTDFGILSEEGISESSKYAKFALLMNAEVAFSKGGHAWSQSFFEACNGLLNPLARVHSMIANAWFACLYLASDCCYECARSIVDVFPSWASDSLTSNAAEAISSCVVISDFQLCSELVSLSRPPLSSKLIELQKRSEARLAKTEEAFLALVDWAVENKSCAVFCEAAEAANEMGVEQSRIHDLFIENSEWMLASFGGLYVFSSLCRDVITSDEYASYENNLGSDPRYYLQGFELFSGRDESFAQKCRASAFELIKSDPSHPCLEWSHVWIPYAMEVEGPETLLEIVKPGLPYLPKIALNRFFAAVEKLNDGDEVLQECFNIIEAADGRCCHATALLARYCFVEGKMAQAANYGLLAFRESGDPQSAGIAVQALLILSADIPQDLVGHIRTHDTASSNIYLAQIAEREGRTAEYESRLLRAVTMGGDEGERALKLLTFSALPLESKPIDRIGGDSCAEIVTAEGERVHLLFHSNPESAVGEGSLSLLGIHFNESSSVYVSLRGARVGDQINCAGLEGTIVSICGVYDRVVAIGFPLIVGDPTTKAIAVGEDNPVEDMLEELKKISSPNKNDVYKNGFTACGQTLYFGIETGARVVGANQLEFLLACLGTALPFRRAQYGFTCSVGKETRFLCSYNAVVVLANLDLPKEVVADVASRCFVTSSTARRLKLDIRQLADQSHTAAGKMAIHDGKLAMYEFDANYREEIARSYSRIESVLGALETIDPSLGISTDLQLPVCDENQIIDIQTAKDNSLILITEDCLEAALIDCLDGVHRCSIYTLFIAANYSFAALDNIAKKYAEMGAEPSVDLNIVDAVRNALNDLFGVDDGGE